MRIRLATGTLGLALIAAAAAALAPAAAGAAGKFKLTSAAFKNNANLPDRNAFNQMGCIGDNQSPALAWSDAPAGTKSFALLVHDPDAPTGSGWWHWVVYDIPADTTSLPEGAGKEGGAGLPKGAKQGRTDFGTAAYGGPCPPPGSGKHHYNFTLLALKVDKLEVPDGASPALVSFSANAAALGKAKLTGMYARGK
ncbi:MAG TPA: YbhB/YbcL family Raf kinase inhibitor-like protein [Polyangia bacterium]|nr:YbhB/YbcL family Raf kinase inhibitor-like protein [Polyangia bacterium]